jgi:hypothetical protein
MVLALIACGGEGGRSPGAVLADAPDMRTTARPSFGTLMLHVHEGRAYRLQSARTETGDHRRRFVVEALEEGALPLAVLWAYPADDEAETNELLDDFTVHPNGEVTLALEHRGVTRDTYELLRFSASGEVLFRAPLPAGALVPDTDLGDLPRPPFRMKSTWNDDALAEGWVRVVATGDDLVLAFMTMVNSPNDEFSFQNVSAVSWLTWNGDAYTETRTRLVDGAHGVGPAAWAYDEFRWRQAAVRPYLAVDQSTGHVVFGRAWSNPRCMSAVTIFGEGSQRDCVFNAVSPIENERVPFAWTSFSAEGEREGTHVFMPEGTSEFVIFDMAASGGQLAIVGSRVREEPDGSVTYYEGNLVPYDGYLARFDRASGTLAWERDIDGSGRADALHAVRFVDGDLLAVGAADWDRWNGGMSISRGSDPWVVFVSSAGDVAQQRVEVDSPARHAHLLAVSVRTGRRPVIYGAGLFEAPMTHSGDGAQVAQMVFGDTFLSLGAR